MSLYIHKNARNLQLQNVAIYPVLFSTSVSDNAMLYWNNVNFQPIGTPGRRVWQLMGSGYTKNNTVDIEYSIATRFNIGFEGAPSGVVTTSSSENAMNARLITRATTSSEGGQTIVKITIQTMKPLLYFTYDIFIDDGPMLVQY